MKFNFCPKCGSGLALKQAGDDGKIPFCKNCNQYYFEMFSTCTIAMVINEFSEVALLKQSYLSDKYMTFVAGYINFGENAENAIKREIKEELGLNVLKLNYALSNWFSQKNLLMLGYIAHVKKQELKLSSEVDFAAWYPLESVPNLIFPDSPDNTASALYKHYRGGL